MDDYLPRRLLQVLPILFVLGLAAGPASLSPASEPGDPAGPLACTAFVLHHGSEVRVGKNLDWPVGLGAVLLNPRGLRKTAWVRGGEVPAAWDSRYASLTFNQLGREFPLGGMNEAGLVVEEISYGPTRYPERDGRVVVNELQWIQYQLDRHATVAAVVADTSVRIAPFLFGIHYLVADAAGDAAVIEFLDGDRIVYAGEALPVAVLANDTYRSLVRYLGFHAGFGGDRVVGRGPESPERFVRAVMAVRRLEAAAKERSGGDLAARSASFDSAFAILDDVAQEDTQWSIVYDPVGLEVRWRTRGDRRLRSARLEALAGDCGGAVVGARIEGDPGPDAWSAWSGARNDQLVEAVFLALARDGVAAVPPTDVQRAMAEHPRGMRCALPREEQPEDERGAKLPL